MVPFIAVSAESLHLEKLAGVGGSRARIAHLGAIETEYRHGKKIIFFLAEHKKNKKSHAKKKPKEISGTSDSSTHSNRRLVLPENKLNIQKI